MAKKKRKSFPKKQLLKLFNNENYQKVISKVKQFEIEMMSEEELQMVLIQSYIGLAQNHFENSSWARAIRDIDSAIALDSNPDIKLTKLKYLCYMEHFKDAITLGEELKEVKEVKKEATFLYLLANLYSHNFDLDERLLKSLPIARKNYILALLNLMQDKRDIALEYLNKIRPRANIEKQNLAILKKIITNEPIEIEDIEEDIKPLYEFLISGNRARLYNSKSSGDAQKELLDFYSQEDKLKSLKSLLELKNPIDLNIIKKEVKDRELRAKLIYNNIILLVEKKEYFKALELFFKNRDDMLKFIESASLIINIKKYIDDNESDNIFISWLIRYIERYHHKISPHQLDFILISILGSDKSNDKIINIAKKYNRDVFILLLEDITQSSIGNKEQQLRFNKIFRQYSIINSTILNILSDNFKSLDILIGTINSIDNGNRDEIEDIINKAIYPLMELMIGIEKVNINYKKEFIELLRVFALLVQNLDYNKSESIYLKISRIIEKYIEMFKINRVDLPIDIKALYISIDKRYSIKNRDFYEEDEEKDLFRELRKSFFGFNDENEQYDFDEEEYDTLAIKKKVIKALEREDIEPFKSLSRLNKSYRYRRYIYPIILDILDYLVKKEDTQKEELNLIIDEIVKSIGISLYHSDIRDDFVKELKDTKRVDISRILYEYALNSVSSNRETVWYLKWIAGYLDFIYKNDLERDNRFKIYLDFFIQTQSKKKFKTLNAKYKNIVKKFINEQGGLF